MTSSECDQKSGIIVNTLSHQSCIKGKSIGEIEGTHCPCICCVGEKVVDCSKNDIELLMVCDAGDELRFSFNAQGKEIPIEISFSLQAKDGSGGAEKTIDSSKKIQVAKYSKSDAQRNFESVLSYTVRYKDVVLMDCRFPSIGNSQNIKIHKCE